MQDHLETLRDNIKLNPIGDDSGIGKDDVDDFEYAAPRGRSAKPALVRPAGGQLVVK